MVCASETKIGSLGSIFFAGWTISAVLIPKYADMNGRKPVLLVTYIAVVCITVGIIFSTSTLFTTILLFFLGMTANGTCNVSFVMMIESSVPEWRASAGSWLNVFGFA